MSNDLITEAVTAIHNKECVVFPTETVYGLGANALDKHSVKKIFSLKNRPVKNPLIVHVSDIDQILKICHSISTLEEKLFSLFSPGPLSLILRKNNNVPYETTGGLETVAVRIPDHPIALDFLSRVEVPIAAPSANLSSKPSPTTYAMAKFYMKDKGPIILDGGNLEIGLESTVIKVENNNIIIVRPGYISSEMIAEKIGIIPSTYPQNTTISPGMIYPHYKPNATVILFDNHMPKPLDNSAILYFSKDLTIPNVKQTFFFDSLEAYAQHLYAVFFQCDTMAIKYIYCQIPEIRGFGSAIRDRLLKAAGS